MNDLQFVIRPGRLEEIDEVLQLWRDAGAMPSATDDHAGLQRLLEHDSQALLVAQIGKVLAGTIIATFDGWRANLYRAAVRPEYRRRGIGSALIAAGEARLGEIGARRAVALVVNKPEAARLWRGAGYDHDPVVSRSVKTL